MDHSREAINSAWNSAAVHAQPVTQSRYAVNVLARFWRDAGALGLTGETAYRWVCLRLEEWIEKQAEYLVRAEMAQPFRVLLDDVDPAVLADLKNRAGQG